MNELKNQVVHMFIAYWVVSLSFFVIKQEWVVGLALLCGLCVEAYQILHKGEPMYWADRALDLTFWCVGGLLNYLTWRMYS